MSLQRMLSDSIEVYQKNAPDFEGVAVPFNAKLTQRPTWIVQPKNTSQVQEIVQVCHQLGLQVGTRGAGFGTQPGICPQGGVLLDTRYLDSVNVHPEKRYVQVQAGVTVGKLDRQTTGYQLATVAPRFSLLNVVGVCLGGGTGLLTKKHGFATANINRAKLVTACSEVVTVDRNNNPNLFWALRGAGQNNFGIVTELELNLHPVPRKMWGGSLRWPLEYAPRIIDQLPKLLNAFGEKLLFDLSMRTQDTTGPVCELFGAYLGDEASGREVFQEMSLFAPKLCRDDGVTSYLELQSAFRDPQGRRPSFLWHHGFVKMGMEAKLVACIVPHMLKHRDLELRFKLEAIGGGFSRSECLIQHQQSSYLYVASGIWKTSEQETRTHAWFDETNIIMHSMLTGFGHPNYHDYQIKDSIAYYFGKYGEKLRTLKQQWDPDGCFIGILHPEYDYLIGDK